TRERFDRLRHAVLKHVKITLRHVIDRFVVAIDDAHVQLDQIGVDLDDAVRTEIFRWRRRGSWFQTWWRWRLTEGRRNAINLGWPLGLLSRSGCCSGCRLSWDLDGRRRWRSTWFGGLCAARSILCSSRKHTGAKNQCREY